MCTHVCSHMYGSMCVWVASRIFLGCFPPPNMCVHTCMGACRPKLPAGSSLTALHFLTCVFTHVWMPVYVGCQRALPWPLSISYIRAGSLAVHWAVCFSSAGQPACSNDLSSSPPALAQGALILWTSQPSFRTESWGCILAVESCLRGWRRKNDKACFGPEILA